MRFRPLHGVVLVLALGGVLLASEYALEGRFSHAGFERVSPDPSGQVRIDVAGLAPGQVRYFRFLNPGNQEVKFLVGRTAGAGPGTVQVAFDANEECFKLKRGYRAENGWLTCNKCEKSFRLEETNAGGGGCRPVPLTHRVEGGELVLAEADILGGWRYFR